MQDWVTASEEMQQILQQPSASATHNNILSFNKSLKKKLNCQEKQDTSQLEL